MKHTSFHRFFIHALVATTALSLTACLGQKQPDRYNYVTGGKRAPLLNPGGANYVPPQEGALEDAAAEAFMNRDLPPADAPRQMVPQTEMNAAVDTQQAALEPSPLYYYEQQNASVGSSELSSEAPVEMSAASVATAIPNQAENTEADNLEISAYSVDPNAAGAENTALEPSPLAVMEAQRAAAPAAEEDSSAFPALNNVPERNQEFSEDYARVQENAENFASEYEQDENFSEYVTVDEYEQANPVEPMPEIAETAQPSALVPNAVNPDIPPVAPIPSNEMEIYERDGTLAAAVPQQLMVQPEADARAMRPINPESLQNPSLTSAQWEAQKEALQSETLAPAATPYEEMQEGMGAYAYQPPQVPDETYYQQQPMDYTQQPLPVESQSPTATAAPSQTYPASPDEVMIGYDETTVDDVVRASSPEQSVSLAQPIAQPPAEPVAVADAPVVADAPYSQQLYTESGAITLRPPQSIAEQRRSRLPESRYSELRRRYSRY